MTTEFLLQNCVPHEIAKSLKEIGFNEECIAFWDSDGEISDMFYYDQECTNSELENGFYYSKVEGFKKECTAPLFQQVFDWFDHSEIYGATSKLNLNIDVSMWHYAVLSNKKEYNGGGDSRKEAQIACIEKMIEIFNQTVGNDISHEEYEQNRINQLKTDGLF